MDKKELRKQVKVLKSQYSLEQKVEMSRPLWKELEQTDFFKEARTVLLYWSMDDEVFTHDYVCKWAGEKTVLLPCVKGDVLELRAWNPCNRERLSAYWSLLVNCTRITMRLT